MLALLTVVLGKLRTRGVKQPAANHTDRKGQKHDSDQASILCQTLKADFTQKCQYRIQVCVTQPGDLGWPVMPLEGHFLLALSCSWGS